MKTSIIKAKWLWVIQVLSGFSLFVLVSIHIYLQHFAVAGGLRNFEQIVDYISLWWALPLEWLFLVSVTIHAILGIRAILIDVGLKIKTVNRLSIFMIVVIVIYGIGLTLNILRWKSISFS